jgi:hypothetical protein
MTQMTVKEKLGVIGMIMMLTLGIFPTPVGALGNLENPYVIPRSAWSDDSHDNNPSELLYELYIDRNTSFRIVQQPVGKGNFVTNLPDFVTEFQLASNYGSIGILAHNYLAGQYFFQISRGQKLKLIYSDKSTSSFIVTKVQQYQALSPNSPTSDFVDLNTGEYLTASQLFKRIYSNQTGNLILQTCIFNDQNPTWGRLFVIAEPLITQPLSRHEKGSWLMSRF